MIREINWSELYSVHSEQLDSDHKQMMTLINILDNSIFQKKISTELLSEVLRKLVEYTKYHFIAEERIMQKHKYPGYEEHKAEHEVFKHDLAVFQDDFSKQSPELHHAISHYLKHWFIRHILTTDKKYDAYFQAKGIKVN